MFFFLFLNPQSISYIAMVYILAFNFTVWWSLPFLLFFAYTSPMKWTMFIRVSDIFPTILIPLKLVAFLGVIWTIYGYVKRNKREKEEILRLAQNDIKNCHPETQPEGSPYLDSEGVPCFRSGCYAFFVYWYHQPLFLS
jgi:cbb3-type cytochrome oxidase subunit 3